MELSEYRTVIRQGETLSDTIARLQDPMAELGTAMHAAAVLGAALDRALQEWQGRGEELGYFR